MKRFKTFYFKESKPLDPELKANLEVFKNQLNKYSEWFEVGKNNLKSFTDNILWGDENQKLIICGEFNSEMEKLLQIISENKQESSICRNLTWNLDLEKVARIVGFDLENQVKTNHLSCIDI